MIRTIKRQTPAHKNVQNASESPNVTFAIFHMAPEVFDGSYDSKCDVWALGCILYVFMCGCLPFNGTNHREVLTKIKSADYSLDYPEFKLCSAEVLDLIKQLLVADPEKRLSASKALNHEWFQKMKDGNIANN